MKCSISKCNVVQWHEVLLAVLYCFYGWYPYSLHVWRVIHFRNLSHGSNRCHSNTQQKSNRMQLTAFWLLARLTLLALQQCERLFLDRKEKVVFLIKSCWISGKSRSEQLTESAAMSRGNSGEKQKQAVLTQDWLGQRQFKSADGGGGGGKTF